MIFRTRNCQLPDGDDKTHRLWPLSPLRSTTNFSSAVVGSQRGAQSLAVRLERHMHEQRLSCCSTPNSKIPLEGKPKRAVAYTVANSIVSSRHVQVYELAWPSGD